MKIIRVEDAENCICCHDITKIVPGGYKGPVFKKGHVITKEDIPELRKLGKEHIYVWEDQPGQIHENDAADRIAAAVAGQGLDRSEPSEGKISLTAQYDGVCVINEALLLKVNLVPDVMVATRANWKVVKRGDIVAGLRAIPLTIDEKLLEAVETICREEAVITVRPLRPLRAGVVTTGSEVYSGLIKDQFGPFLQGKLAEYGCSVLTQTLLPDDMDKISREILAMAERGADFILVTGGMSVDPDDVTPKAIANTGATVISHGTPILPGAMLMVSYLGDTPVFGLPGGVMHAKTSAFDLLLPFVIAGTRITRETLAKFGLGGLCLKCPVCHFPHCSFGTGV